MQHRFRHLEVLGQMVVLQVVLGEIEKGVVQQQSVLKGVVLGRGNLHVGSDAVAAVNRASTVGVFDLAAGGFAAVVALKVIVVERNSAVVALNEASAWGVVLGRGQSQPGILREREYGLHQALA